MKLFISNLNYNTLENEVKELFEKFGVVNSVKIITDKLSGRSKGFGFIEMENSEEAKKALEALHKTDFKQRTLNVAEAIENQQTKGFGGGGTGGFNKDSGAKGSW